MNMVVENIHKRIARLEEKVAALERIAGHFYDAKEDKKEVKRDG